MENGTPRTERMRQSKGDEIKKMRDTALKRPKTGETEEGI